MVGSFLTPKWPILVPFCEMDHEKSNFSLIYHTLSIRGCWGQPMLLLWKLVDETQMVKPPELTSHYNLRKNLILLPLRAIYFRLLYYETPCSDNHILVIIQETNSFLTNFLVFIFFSWTVWVSCLEEEVSASLNDERAYFDGELSLWRKPMDECSADHILVCLLP